MVSKLVYIFSTAFLKFPASCFSKNYGYFFFSFFFNENIFWVLIKSASFNSLCLDSPKGLLANSADPDQMLQNMASDQGLHYLQLVELFFSRVI